jgi:hypothetical protein
MSIFSTILSKLGFGDAYAADAPVITPEAVAAAPEVTATAVTPSAASSVDVVSHLEHLAANHGEKLNWKTSIVDLLKLLGLDSSLEARKHLAQELACPEEKMSDSAQMNMWLHKEVMKRVAANGGNLPAELLS